jgi:hypothetical protein
LDNLPQEIKPIIQPIDDWNDCRKLGLLFEASVGTGKLLVCSIDIQNNLDKRITARQLRYSLLTYMEGDEFNPQVKLTVNQVKPLIQKTRDSKI